MNFDLSNPTTQAMIGGFVRSGLIWLAGILGASGYFTSTDAATAAGIIVGLAGLVWSIIQKRSSAKAANTQVAVAIQAVQAPNAAPGAAAAVVAAHAANPGDVSAMRAAARSGSF